MMMMMMMIIMMMMMMIIMICLAASPPLIARAEVELLAPVTSMDKVLCIGMNYKDHCEEQGVPIPQEPLVFNKFPSCVAPPTADLPLPSITGNSQSELSIILTDQSELRIIITDQSQSSWTGRSSSAS